MNSMYLLERSIVIRSIGDKYWALDISSGNQYRLNEVSHFTLNLLRVQMSTDQVVEEILREYEVDRDQAATDCSNVIRFAIEKNIIKEVSNS